MYLFSNWYFIWLLNSGRLSFDLNKNKFMIMKNNIFFYFLVVILAFSVQVAHAQETDKEKIKHEKEKQKLTEKQEKERLKKPPQIEINASSSDISKMIVNIYKAKNYKVDFIGKTKIGMSLMMPVVNNQTSTGGSANYKIIISLDEKDGKTKVTLNLGMLASDSFGRIGYTSLDSDKKNRAEIDAILKAVKEKIEGN